MKTKRYAVCSALIVTNFMLPAGAETLDTLAEFGNAATANATSGAGTPRGADYTGAAAGTYTLTAGGTDLWGTSDNGSFIYDANQTRGAGENFSVIVRSVSVAGDPLEAIAGEWGRTGPMARKTPDAADSATIAHIRKTGNNNITVLQARPADGAATDRNGGEFANGDANIANGTVRNTPIWLGLHRYDGDWYATWADDNAGSPGTWSDALSRVGTPDLAGEVYVGLAHQSHNINPVVNTALFEQFSVGAFGSEFGNFPVSVTCDVALSGNDVALTALTTELGAPTPIDSNWEVRYYGPEVPVAGGLKADIYVNSGNPGNAAAVNQRIAYSEPSGTTTIEQIHWAANAYTTTNAGGVNLFAEAVPGQFGGNQSNYGVNMTGEIHIPNDTDRGGIEEILFHDGCDDYCYLEIDGVVLIDNNSWSNLAGTGNGGGTQATLDVSDPKFNDGEWVSFRMTFWEGGGGDDSILVWDALDTTGIDTVTGGVDATTSSYLGTGLGDGAQVPFAHDFSDKIPAANFRTPLPELQNTVAGFGQPDGQLIDPLAADTVYLEVYVEGDLCLTTPTRPIIASSDFISTNVFEVVLQDAGSGGVSDVDVGTLSATLDGTPIVPTVATGGGLTTLTYTFPAPPSPYTPYTMAITGTTTAGTGGDPIDLTTTVISLPFLDELRAGLPAPPNATVGWDYMEFSAVDTLGGPLGAGQQGFIDAQTVISTAAAPSAQANQPFVNHADPDSNAISGDWNPDLPILLDTVGVGDDQIVTYARTTITIGAGEEGDYTFRIRGDDGYGLRVNNATFTSIAGAGANELDPRDPSVAFFPVNTGDSNAFAVCNFPAAGDYLVEFFGFEGNNGAYQEISWAPGALNNLNQSNDWVLLGDSSQFVDGVSRWGDIPVEALPPAPAPGEAGWSSYLYYNAAVGNLNNTLNYLRNTALPENATAVLLDELNHADNGANGGRFNPSAAFPGDPNPGEATDNIALISRAYIVAPVTGPYTIQVRSDDGFLLRWANPATTFTDKDGAGELHGSAPYEITHPAGTGDSNTRASVNLTAGVHELLFIWWEGNGGAHFEISSAPGVELSQDGPYELLSTAPSATNLYVGEGAREELIITDFSYDNASDRFTLTFNSTNNTFYNITAGTNLMEFETPVESNVPGTGVPVTYGPFPNPIPGQTKVFFRVEVAE